MARRKEEKKAKRLAQKALREKEALEGANKGSKVCSSNAKSPFKTVEEEQAENKNVAIDYLKTMQRLLPGLLKRLSEVEDYRNPKKIKHKVDVRYVEKINHPIICFRSDQNDFKLYLFSR
jgi:hypothetical protein